MRLLLLASFLTLVAGRPALAEIAKYNPDINRDGGYSIVESILTQQRLFHDMDADQNGQLTLNELANFMEKAKKSQSFKNLKTRFEYIDANNDKYLSELEFLEGVENEFRRKDRNKDNILTTNEMPT